VEKEKTEDLVNHTKRGREGPLRKKWTELEGRGTLPATLKKMTLSIKRREQLQLKLHKKRSSSKNSGERGGSRTGRWKEKDFLLPGLIWKAFNKKAKEIAEGEERILKTARRASSSPSARLSF